MIDKLCLKCLSILYAAVAELADALDLGSNVFGRAGSIPVSSIYSRLAQSVEQMTVNHWVVGSSPTAGANKYYVMGAFGLPYIMYSFFSFHMYIINTNKKQVLFIKYFYDP